MKEQIEQYEPKESSVVALGTQRVRAFVADEAPRLGQTLWIGNIPTRIVALAGGRRVEALAFDTSGIAVGDAVRCTDEIAQWPAPRRGRTELADLGFEPGRTVAAESPRGEPRSASSDIDILDRLLPLAVDGITLVLDCEAPDTCADRLYAALEAPIVCASARPVSGATHQIVGDSGLALTVATQWARELGASLVLEGPPFDLDTLFDGVSVGTTVVRAVLRDGLEFLAETLELGRCDTQIVLRPDGTIDLARSTSRLKPTDPRFAVLERVREQLQIFGEHDVEPGDLAVLREADDLEAGLLR